MRKEYTDRPNIFGMRDYRAYLRAFFLWRKSRGRYSFRTFSLAANLRSPNYLKLVIDGDRNLSLDLAPNFAEACGLNREETAFFLLLIRYANARDLEDRAQLFRLLESHRQAEGTVPDLDAYEAFFSHWAYPVLCLLIGLPHINQDPKQLGKMLSPPMSAQDVHKALEVLLQLGRIQEVDGRYIPTDTVMETPLEIAQIWMRQYHLKVLERAKDALENTPQNERNISGFAVTLPESQIPEFLAHVHRLRRELFRYARTLSEAAPEPDDTVYQLAVQAFPVAKVEKVDK